MNSGENAAVMSSATPNAARPSALSATWRTVVGSVACGVALATGACASHARAAARSRTRSARNTDSV